MASRGTQRTSPSPRRSRWPRGRTEQRLRDDNLDLIVFDEITYPVNWGWIDVDDIVAALRGRSPKVHVVLTGRDCPSELGEVSDTVTELAEVKHAFHEGVMARRGIDY